MSYYLCMEINAKKIAKFFIILIVCLSVFGFFVIIFIYLGIRIERARMSNIALELDSIQEFDDNSNLNNEIHIKVD